MTARVYRPRGEWTGPQHRRALQFDGLPEAGMSGAFFWTLTGEPFLRRIPSLQVPYVPRHSVEVVMPPPEPDATVVEATWPPAPVLAARHQTPEYNEAVAAGRARRCPDCEFVSFHPEDVRTGFCGFCHAFTAAYREASPSGGYHVGGATRGHLQAVGYDYTRETT